MCYFFIIQMSFLIHADSVFIMLFHLPFINYISFTFLILVIFIEIVHYYYGWFNFNSFELANKVTDKYNACIILLFCSHIFLILIIASLLSKSQNVRKYSLKVTECNITLLVLIVSFRKSMQNLILKTQLIFVHACKNL